MPALEDVKALLRILEVGNKFWESLQRGRKYVDGIVPPESIADKQLLELVGRFVKEVGREDIALYLTQGASKDSVREVLERFGSITLYVEGRAQELSSLKELGGGFGGRVKVGVRVNHPAPNIARLAKLGVGFVTMPPALIRGRVVREAVAKGVELIADTVNDVATFAKLIESGVYTVITEDPVIKREVRKLLKI